MVKICTIVGARPQFIKAAVVSKEILLRDCCKEVMIHTGQHFDDNMSKVFFDEMGMPEPAYMLDINSSSHGEMTGKMICEIEKILIAEQPSAVLVYGDTNSTLAGALAAVKLEIPVIHVEAGLRSFNMAMPEELNRILTDRISSLLFCPTKKAKSNLLKEGFIEYGCDIVVSGDVMYDSALLFANVECSSSTVLSILKDSKPYVLATVHRAENTNNKEKLKAIFAALDRIAQETVVIMPLHPRTKQYLKKYSIESKVQFIEPLGYVEMLKLIKKSSLIITDSGGLQKEAYFFNKFCITVRDETEWVELVENGYNKLTGADQEKIYVSYLEVVGAKLDNKKMLYGDGGASKVIVDFVSQLISIK